MALPLQPECGPDYTMAILVLLLLVLGSAAAAEKPSSDAGATLRVLKRIDLAIAMSSPLPDNIATTGKGSQNVLFVEKKKTNLMARKQHNLFERSMLEKLTAAIIERAVLQALIGGGTEATTNKGNKTRKIGFRPRYSSRHRIYL